MIQSLTACELFKRCPQAMKQLWGGEFWTDGSTDGTIGKHGNENTIDNSVQEQGKQYQKLYENRQLNMIE